MQFVNTKIKLLLSNFQFNSGVATADIDQYSIFLRKERGEREGAYGGWEGA